MRWIAPAALVVGLAVALAATAQTPAPAPPRGAQVFKERCKDCHDPAAGDAPSKEDLAKSKADDIFAVLKTGLMQPMAEGLSDDDLHAVAAWLTTPPAP